MFGFERQRSKGNVDRELSKEDTPVHLEEGQENQVSAEGEMSRRKFLSGTGATVLGLSSLSIGESVDAAEGKINLEINGGIQLSEHNLKFLKLRLKSLVGNAENVQVSFKKETVKEYGLNETIFSVRLNIIKNDGSVVEAKGVSFNTGEDQDNLNRLLTSALKDLEGKIQPKH